MTHVARALVLSMVAFLLLAGWRGRVDAAIDPQKRSLVLARVLAGELALAERVGDAYTIAVVFPARSETGRRHSADIASSFAVVQRLKLNGLPVRIERLEWETLAAGLADGSMAHVDAVYPTGGFSAEGLDKIVAAVRAGRMIGIAHSADAFERGLDLGVLPEGDELKVRLRADALAGRGIRFSDDVRKIATLVPR